MKKRIVAAIIALSTMVLCLTAKAQTGQIPDAPEPAVMSLQGLGGVMVSVASLPALMEEIGFTRRKLETEIEARLIERGIRVYPRIPTSIEEYEMRAKWVQEGSPLLSISINYDFGDMKKLTEASQINFSVDISLSQQALLTRDVKNSLAVTTWEQRSLYLTRKGTVQDVHDDVLRKVAAFLSAYDRANSKGASQEILLPWTNVSSPADIFDLGKPALWQTFDGAMKPQIFAALGGGTTFQLPAVPAGHPYDYQYGGLQYTMHVDLERYPVIAAYVSRVQTGSYAHFNVEARDSKGELLQARSTPTLQKLGLTWLDLGKEWKEQPQLLQLRLYVGGALSGASCDYAWVRFVRREDLPRLQSMSPNIESVDTKSPDTGKF